MIQSRMMMARLPSLRSAAARLRSPLLLLHLQRMPPSTLCLLLTPLRAQVLLTLCCLLLTLQRLLLALQRQLPLLHCLPLPDPRAGPAFAAEATALFLARHLRVLLQHPPLR